MPHHYHVHCEQSLFPGGQDFIGVGETSLAPKGGTKLYSTPSGTKKLQFQIKRLEYHANIRITNPIQTSIYLCLP